MALNQDQIQKGTTVGEEQSHPEFQKLQDVISDNNFETEELQCELSAKDHIINAKDQEVEAAKKNNALNVRLRKPENNYKEDIIFTQFY